MKLSKHEIIDIIERLQNGENLPDDYKYKLFPVTQKEYELVYGGKMRREDILANEDGVFPVPLQVEKIYNGSRKQWDDGWRNIIAFGDNLQLLKTIYENKDPLIKDKVKGKVKLIYIDPPFASEADYKTDDGVKAFNDKVRDAEFIEFLRRRLIVAKEILSDDGSIYVHLDEKKSHYIKIILDEIGFQFQREIVWRIGWISGYKSKASNWIRNHDVVLFYTKGNNFLFNKEYIPYPLDYVRRDGNKPEGEGYPIEDTWNSNELDPMNSIQIMSFSSEKTGYPTQKNENLLKRIIRASTNEGDIVLDFFGGAGTTAAVAEKINRKWIACDIGKLAFYTMQKRLLNIQISKSLENPKKEYGKPAKSFVAVNTGQYDLEKVFKLEQEEYQKFVMDLFEVEPKNKTIGGIRINGERKDGYNVIIWEYWKFKDAAVDEEYLHDLHGYIGNKAGKRVYIIAPASYVSFISDYYEIDKVRYYFLKVPYQVIRELHKVQFKKFRQPQSKNNVNDLDDAVGFHFMRQPEVKSNISVANKEVQVVIKKFLSDYTEDETGREIENFESLSMVLVDKDFNGSEFDMDEYYFADDLLPKKKKKSDDDAEQNLKEELKHTKEIKLPAIPLKECGKRMMLIYIDVYGNEFKEELKVK